MAGTPYLDGALCGIVRCQSVGTGRPITDAGIKEDKPPRLIALCSTAGMLTCSPLAARIVNFVTQREYLAHRVTLRPTLAHPSALHAATCLGTPQWLSPGFFAQAVPFTT